MSHLKRINAPKTWPIQRKTTKFVTKPNPGVHKLDEGMPIGVILREILNLAKTKRQIKIILNAGNFLVNNQIRKDFGFSAGIMDSISILLLNKHYRILHNNLGKLSLVEISKEEAEEKTYKIIGKKILKKNKMQLNLYGGKNILTPKGDYNVSDSVVIKDNKIMKHLKLEKGAAIYLIGGKHAGSKAILTDVKKFIGPTKDVIAFKLSNKAYETLADYAYVIEIEK
ncbi:30S ribosomal protein S4e [Candidatus Woesearchaeota archaeon]|nr:30S ribosomal protein S4e [Candidatus Woesearchaeota archaeon]